MKIIRLVTFNEDYWSNSLIYTQNIRPLLELSKKRNIQIEICSFTPLIIYIMNYKVIRDFIVKMEKEGVSVYNFPTLYYPTRIFITRWFLIPFLWLNTFIYVLILNLKDSKKDVVYNLRSYESALAFLLSYKHKERLVFDTRTDWIEECVNSGYYKANSLSATVWLNIEGKMLRTFNKTLFISERFRANVLNRQEIEPNENKYVILLNPIDFSHFNQNGYEKQGNIFLYTGSFGEWNRLELYLDFFSLIKKYIPEAKLIICTSTKENRVRSVLEEKRYFEINDSVELHFNVPISKLPMYYCKCDYGLQLMSKKDSRVGVKVIEYIAACVTPIVSENVQGAAQLITQYDLGVVINNDDTPIRIIAKIKQQPRIVKDSDNYKSIKKVADLSGIEERMANIYM